MQTHGPRRDAVQLPAGNRRGQPGGDYDSKPGVEGNAVTENHIFGKATPSATFKMTILNPDAFQEFRKALDNQVPFYVDFTPAQ
jgi:hypothetical protein